MICNEHYIGKCDAKEIIQNFDQVLQKWGQIMSRLATCVQIFQPLGFSFRMLPLSGLHVPDGVGSQHHHRHHHCLVLLHVQDSGQPTTTITTFVIIITLIIKLSIISII